MIIKEGMFSHQNMARVGMHVIIGLTLKDYHVLLSLCP